MTIREQVTIEDVIDLLNEAASLDPGAMEALVAGRVGLLGILNGLFGADVDGWGVIAAEIGGEPPAPIRFLRLNRENPKP